ncbi:uncharacterized protein LOC110859490 [Folsomia candida]|uniref:uncharacterized protein LOC110859490 n=1 Tax=Folsomia candida TaxID=158441 RepID=UPI001604B2BE|nr:uncharacterized protein LOC110859490 [Folsomia candida]
MAHTTPGNSSPREFTILLLGETGVGKSTWINGFANFVNFPDLSAAEENNIHCIIPTTFTVTDENYKAKLITVGQDINEVMDVGQSATQHPKSYLFPKDGYTVRLIDTPGIGDVRGVKQDKKNFELILDHISHLDSIHAICILLKPNNARLNIVFQFCIKELLSHLHIDACANIVFCFTNSRSTFYRPGDTLPALEKLLEENPHAPIPLDRSTIYCMDNEAIRFLYATKNGIKFTPDERRNYVASWEKSVEEIDRLLARAKSCPPHSVQSTISLNTARQTILALGSPMAEVTRNIQLNIVMKQAHVELLKNSKASKDEISQQLIQKVYETRMRNLNEPRTVCTASSCVEYVDVKGIKECKYKSHCHTNCGTGKEKHFKIANIVGHKNLKKCSAFNSDGMCKRCSCSWQVHMKITYETFIVEKEVHNVEKHLELQNQENSIEIVEQYVNSFGIYIDDLRQEQEEITKASIEFAKFLRVNAITPFNNAMDAYMEHFIREEWNKMASPGGGNPKVYEGLQKMQANYRDQMKILEVAMQQKCSGPPLTSPELDQLIKNLCKMKHSGRMLRQMMETSQISADSCYTENVVHRNATLTTVPKPLRKMNNVLDGIIEWINPEKSVKSGETSGLEYDGNRNAHNSASQLGQRKPLVTSKSFFQEIYLQFRPRQETKTSGRLVADGIGEREQIYTGEEEPAVQKSAGRPAYRPSKRGSPRTRLQPPKERAVAPPVKSRAPLPPTQINTENHGDHGHHQPPISEARPSSLEEIRIERETKSRTDGELAAFKRAFAAAAAKFDQDPEWN